MSIDASSIGSITSRSTDHDSKIGQPEYVGITTAGQPFSPNTLINDARQRWLSA
jgi:hypothetical protein